MPRVVITGVNRGIGRALVDRFLLADWDVDGIGRREPVFDGAAPTSYTHYTCDLTDAVQLEAITQAYQRPVDILINSAAVFGGDAYYANHFSVDALRTAFDVNLVAPALLARAMIGHMQNSAHKLVVMMSTGNASIGGNHHGEMFAYRLTKSALNQAMRTMSHEWKATGICFVALNPGWVRTDMGGDNAPLSAQDAADAIFNFCTVIVAHEHSGRFVNTDGSELPW